MKAMKGVLAGVLALNLLVFGWPAAAQPDDGRRERFGERPEQSRPEPQRPHREAVWPTRDAHDQGHGRMSPEERRQLRRDINSHGRDIYRQDRGRR
jgi:hypothetical protein